jgi:hypothetical protein
LNFSAENLCDIDCDDSSVGPTPEDQGQFRVGSGCVRLSESFDKLRTFQRDFGNGCFIVMDISEDHSVIHTIDRIMIWEVENEISVTGARERES